ncbi:hypothetical protein HY626_01730 [Candidatus Uhrbacteria bacterium]|nr:hypothetical protein [Candidatus Uhrbacteria bacterium]
MRLFWHKHKRWFVAGVLSLCVGVFLVVGIFSFVQPVYAVDSAAIAAGELAAGAAEGGCTSGGPSPVPCPQKGIKQSLQIVGEKILSPTFRIALIQALLNLSQFVLNRLAYEAAVAIASGGPGEDSLFYNQTPSEAFGQLGLEVAGEAIGSMSQLSSSKLGIEFDLCQPSSQSLQLALSLGIKQKYQPSEPKCDFMEVLGNWEKFGADIYQKYLDPEGRQEAILKTFASALKPGQNELTATLRINIAIDQKVHEQKLLQFLERNESTYKNVKDFITGTVKTPSETLQADFEEALKKAKGDDSQIRVGELANAGDLIGGLALSTASTFTNVLLSQLLNRIYTGLFDTEVVDPFDLEAVGAGDREAAQERFASIITTNPIATTEYDALSEFVVCTAQGTINRGLYNCVMDVNFLAAVNRGTAGVPLTVQEAIDEGLLDGDWPLIAPDNEAANQDPFCYTYGYCYGNLVKLRKARVLPIGWELAASRNSESNPATLQEVIDGFNDCTQEGTIGSASTSDSDSKWCHLIDPNWVLKYPKTECRAVGNGEIRISTLSSGRNTTCVDSPSCIGEDNKGNCVDGYGYCTQEKNVWRFRGDECPAQYATCLSFTNTQTGDDGDFLVSTVNYSVCDQDNAGCRWYRTNKYLEDAGTTDTEDDTYEWLATGDEYLLEERDVDWNYWDGSGSVGRTSYVYTSDSGETYTYEQYAYEDRLYLTNDATQCSENDVGCTQLYEFDETVYLNSVQNPSFEEDEDADGTPDGWVPLTAGGYTLDTSNSEFGSTSLLYSAGTLNYLYQDISASENNFYTFSTYFQAQTSGDSGVGLLLFLDEDGNSIDASGTSSSGDCEWSSVFNLYLMVEEPDTADFERFECLVTAPEGTVQIRVGVGNSSFYSSDEVYIDAVQLELGEDANIFAEGYSGTPTQVYYQVAPSYLGCTGNDTDPEECDSYAQVCTAQEVGCRLYTPEDGDPNVPAIISDLDTCPSECVGYTTYKQEATDFERESFPLYFIADSASVCASQYVGCDSYTNLGAVDAGGEGIEYYTDLRFCLSPDIADATATNKTPATYFTWEGSDNEGYQLQTWSLLQSNSASGSQTFVSSGYTELAIDLAPCTHRQMTSENVVVCDDTSANLTADVWTNEDCDEHDDIFNNPDCREFFDTKGNIHYRQYSDTISISDACSAYRKDESEETDCEDSGGWWTDQGFCRYYVLPEESVDCPAEQNGCREYTGGTGRNATTILSETFEGGTYEDFVMAEIGNYPDEISISNESVATEGHSLYVLAPSSGMAGIETTQIYLDSTVTTEIYDEAGDAAGTSTTCTSNGGTIGDSGCDIADDIDGDGSDDEDCSVLDGQESCGALTGYLVAGKTFVLDFWAKGNGNLYVTFGEQGGAGDVHDFVDPNSGVSDLTPVALDGSWVLYSLGPVDTSAYADFDENAVVRFATDAEMEFYLDNVTLKQVEENITIIKNSWVVPSTCDQTPEGVDSDQYYLGCEAYTDHNGSAVDLYQFSDLCSEEVVGCEGFYHTANSDSPYTQVYNARCMYSSDTDFTDDDVVTRNTACKINEIEYCTIIVGESYCLFDADQAFPGDLPVEEVSSSEYYAVVYGSETVIVPGDTPVYIVADESDQCASSAMGCQELGKPTYTQDQREVESFESVYYINLPADYDSILCDQEALFCEEWASTQDGNFYFKDPLDKECEYKTSVTINNRSYFGWFRTGTNEPCYWEDKDGDGVYDQDEDEAYLIAGEEFGVWNNGDQDDGDTDYWDFYDGWVASCSSKYDLCTEFIDVVDTGGGLNEDGQSYYFTNDDLLSEDTLTDSQRCNGQVSQKFGCALFNNTTVSELTYHASASYVLSTHADVFYGTEMNDLVDPISCTTQDGGVFTISDADAAIAGTGTEVDLCARRCAYTVESGDQLTTTGSEQGAVDTVYYNGSCFVDSDCGLLTTYKGEDVSGTCTDVVDAYALEDDTNEVIKVNRDRSCAAWLSCESSRTSWNTQTNTYDTICDSINLCVEGQQQGDRAICSQWDQSDPSILSAYHYSVRDVSWTGYEYSGNAIPNQLPVELYDQYNIAAQSVCVNSSGVALTGSAYITQGDTTLPRACGSYADCPLDSSARCSTDSDCTSNSGHASGVCDRASGQCYFACENSNETDYRLVYNAGPCDSTESGDGNGGSCVIGHCEDSAVSCASDDDCSDGESCVVGYLQATGTVGCDEDCSCNPDENEGNGTNADCSGVTSSSGISTLICDPIGFVCVDELTTNVLYRDACVTDSSNRTCVPASTSTTGSCFNDRCLTDILDVNGDGFADRLEVDDAREQSCRAYPEIDSPFPTDVVQYWIQYTAENIEADGESPVSSDSNSKVNPPTSQAALPYSYVNGFQDSTTCAIDASGNPVDCICSYDKAEYGDGTGYRYFELGTGVADVPEGICSGGPVNGIPCQDDDDCSFTSTDGKTTQSGICSYVSRVDSVYGWNGYCIEKDSSIQTLGSSAPEDQACLTWLPVDQLTGATDLYAKYTSAGYQPQDTYYCAEVELGYTVGTSEIACAEVQDNNCNDGSDWQHFSNEADNSRDSQDDCVAAVWCPDGFFAVMTGCGSNDTNNECTASGDKDCPYFCVPKLSYKTQDDDRGVSGDTCLTPDAALGITVESSPFTANNDADAPTGAYYLNVNSVGDHWAGLAAPNIRVYVLPPTDFDTAVDYYDDCEARGVLSEGAEAFSYSEYTGGGVDFLLSTYDAGGALSGKGFRNLNNNFVPGAVCTSVVQVSAKSTQDEQVLPFDTYNAAWTNKLWDHESNTQPLSSSNPSFLGYQFGSLQSPYGIATDYLSLKLERDPEPWVLAMCLVEGYGQELPPVDLVCDSGDVVTSSSGEDARANRDVSLTVQTDVISSYCLNVDCDCNDSGEENEQWCNWNSSSGAAVYCGGGYCENDNSISCSFIDANEDGVDDTCEDEGVDGACAAGTCVGGSYDGLACEGDQTCWVNYCHGSYSTDGSRQLSGATCIANDDAPVYALSVGSKGDAIGLLSQIFGRIYGIVEFTDDGYGEVDTGVIPTNETIFTDREPLGDFERFDFDTDNFETSFSDWIWDTRASAQDNPEDKAPTIVSIGECEGTLCYEGVKNKFSVNEVDSADIEGEGSKHVTVAFYAYADSDQMPIRRVIVDWGDNMAGIGGNSNPWPFGSYSGSIARNNFYKNYRGLNSVSDSQECSNDPDEFGQSSNACSSSYIAFTHDYTCTTGRLAQLEGRECIFDEEDGRLIYSPCVSGDFCVFQPRVHVMDNWGWCTGYCTAGDDGTEGCYTGVIGSSTQDECNIEECPSENNSDSICEDSSGRIVNPWINYDGVVKILTE